MKKMVVFGLALSLSVCSLNSCDKVKEAAEAVENAAEAKAILSDAAELQKAEDALKALPLYKDKDVKVFQNVQFYGGTYPRITIELINPDNGEDVDHYEYKNGAWSAAQPVQISGGGDMKANSTPLKDIKFATVATIFNNWKEKAASLEGVKKAEPEYIYFSLWVPNQTREWNADNIETSRAEYNIEFKMDGSIKEFKKR